MTGPVTKALAKALRDVHLQPRDAAAVQLAKTYATQVDTDPDMVWRVGPRLLEVLIELGMTPKARTGVVRGGRADDSNSRTKLDEFRDRRQRRTKAMDSPAS